MPTILIVDDELPIRRMVEQILTRNHYRVLSAGNGQEALALALTEHPDLILTDLKMPVMDGPTAIRHLQHDPRTAAIPIVIVTASAFDEFQGLVADLSTYPSIAKPFQSDTLLHLIAQVLTTKKGA